MRVMICLRELPSFVLALPAVFAVVLPRPIVRSSQFISLAIVKKKYVIIQLGSEEKV